MAETEAIHNWRELDNRITTSGQPTELGSSLWLTMTAGYCYALFLQNFIGRDRTRAEWKPPLGQLLVPRIVAGNVTCEQPKVRVPSPVLGA
jgi:hypothetical protein